MLALPISALRPSSTPRVPQTRRNTATLDAVDEFRAAAGFHRPKDVYWNNLELVDALSTKTFAKMPSFVSEKTIKACSKGAMEAFENQGGHDGMYLNKPWKNSRIYSRFLRRATHTHLIALDARGRVVLGALGEGSAPEHRAGLRAGQRPRRARPSRSRRPS